MRNIVIIFALFAFGTAWAVDPLVGPGKVGEKDEKGHVKGTDTGAGPHRRFAGQYERQVERPEAAAANAKKEKDEKAAREAKEASKAR